MKYIFFKTLGATVALWILASCQNTTPESPLLAYQPISKVILTDSAYFESPFKVAFKPLDMHFIYEKKTNLSHFYDKYVGASTFSGSFLVAKNGVVLFEKYQGLANVPLKHPITENTPMHVASISKVLTATAILKLVQDEKLSLDQKVNTILEDFPYPETTIRTLLNHRSGLPHYSRFGELIKGWNHKNILTNEMVYQLLAQHKLKLVYKHDTKFNYCNTNYVMLALIIENLMETDFDSAMTTLIFKPLKMNDTFVFDFFSQKDDVCQSYKSNNINYGWDQFDALYGDKNIYTTPRDLLKFDVATYSENFINQELLAEAMKGYSYETQGINNYGLGMRMKEFEDGKKIHYHNGWWHGNTSSYVTLKKDTVTIISISNRYSKRPYQVMQASAYFDEYPFTVPKINIPQDQEF